MTIKEWNEGRKAMRDVRTDIEKEGIMAKLKLAGWILLGGLVTKKIADNAYVAGQAKASVRCLDAVEAHLMPDKSEEKKEDKTD